MWYEILPSFFAFAGCVSLAFVVPPTVNMIFLGKPAVRQPFTDVDRLMIRRDNVLDPTGNMNCNHARYWEGLPSEEATASNSSSSK